MEAPALSDVPGVRLALGFARPPAGGGGAAPAYPPREAMGYEDRAAAEIAVRLDPPAASRAQLLRLLIECRRVLREGGPLFLACPTPCEGAVQDDMHANDAQADAARANDAHANRPDAS